MSDREIEITTLSEMDIADKYIEAGISIYSLKTTESMEEIKPLKQFSDNILENIKNESKYKQKLLKKKDKNKFLTNLSKTAKEEYDNFIMINREKKFRSYFHDSESKSKKYCSEVSAKNFEKIKNLITIKHVENRAINKEKNSDLKIQKEIKCLHDQMFITNIDKQAKLIDNIKKINSNLMFKYSNNLMCNSNCKRHNSCFSNYSNNNIEVKNIPQNDLNKIINSHNNNEKTNQPCLKKSNNSLSIEENIKIKTAEKVERNTQFNNNNNIHNENNTHFDKANTRNGSGESDINYLIDENSIEKCEFDFTKKNYKNEKVINIYDDFPLDDNNIYSTINFSPICDRRNNLISVNILANKNADDNYYVKNIKNKVEQFKSTIGDSDFYNLYSDKNNQANKKLINFNKNPGLIKRGNFRFSCTDVNNYINKRSINNLSVDENEIKTPNSNDYNGNNYTNNQRQNGYAERLPDVYQSPENKLIMHRKNKSQIAFKNNFLDSLNKYTNEKSNKDILINKNIVYNSANDYESKLNQVKSMEKTEVFNRSNFKSSTHKEKMYKFNKREKDLIMLKTKFDNFLANNKDFLNSNFSKKNFSLTSNQFKNENFNKNNNSINAKSLINDDKKNSYDRGKEKVKMDLYSLKKIKNLNIFGEDNPYYAEKKLDNTYGIFSNMKELKKIKHMKTVNPKYLKENKKANLNKIEMDNNNKKGNDLHVLSKTGSFTIFRTVKDHVKGYHPINKNINEEEKRSFLIDVYNRKKF